MRGGAGVQARVGTRASFYHPLAQPTCSVRWEGHRVRAGLVLYHARLSCVTWAMCCVAIRVLRKQVMC